VRRADNLTTFMCRLSKNLGPSTSWNPKGLSRPVMGLLYLYLKVITYVVIYIYVEYEWAGIVHLVQYCKISYYKME
jgi:hypothetical protein